MICEVVVETGNEKTGGQVGFSGGEACEKMHQFDVVLFKCLPTEPAIALGDPSKWQRRAICPHCRQAGSDGFAVFAPQRYYRAPPMNERCRSVNRTSQS